MIIVFLKTRFYVLMKLMNCNNYISAIDSEDFDLENINKSKVLDKFKSKLELKKENVAHQSSFGCNTCDVLIS